MALYNSIPRSLIAFFFFIAMYASIFYIFNLSPSTLLYNSSFWFAISNTLLVIITVDYSSSKYKHVQINHQKEYMMDMKAQTASRFVSEYPSKVIKHTIITDYQVADQTIENRESSSQTVLEDEPDQNPSVDEFVFQEKRKVEVQSKESEELKRGAMDESKSNIMWRLETVEKHEETQASTPEEDTKFPTNEELSSRIQLLRNKSGLSGIQFGILCTPLTVT